MRAKTRSVFIAAAAAGLAAGWAAKAEAPANLSRIGGAALGMVFDPAVQGIRPLAGVPGAAVLGPRREIGFDLGQAAVSPLGNYALAEAAAGSALFVLIPEAGGLAVRALDGVAPAPDRMALSPTGSTAALYYSAGSVVRIVTGLPDSPAAAFEVDLSALPGPAVSLAVSDDAQLLLAGTSAAASGDPLSASVYLFTAGGGFRRTAAVGEATALAFERDSHDAWLADRAQNAILRMRDGQDFLAFAGEPDGISGPAALDVSGGNGRVLVANAASNSVASIDVATRAVSVVECNCAVSELQRLRGRSVFRVGDASSGVVWLFDGDAPAPRMVFVPPAANGQ